MFKDRFVLKLIALFLCSLMVTMGAWTAPRSVAYAQDADVPPGDGGSPPDGEPGEPGAGSTLEELLETQRFVYESLFEGPFMVEEEFTYPLDFPVEDIGTYTGSNMYGEPFELEVLLASPVDVMDPDLEISDEERAWAASHGFRYHGVVGTLRSDRGSVAINGLAVWQESIQDSRLLVSGLADATGMLFNEPASIPALEILPIWPFPLCFPWPIFCPDPDCVEDCQDAYDQAVADAQSDYDDAVDQAQTAFDIARDAATATRDAAINAANAAYNAARNAAQNSFAAQAALCTATLTAAHIGCAFVGGFLWFTGGAAALACILAADAAYAGCMAVAAYTYDQAIAAAQAARTAAINAANAGYQASMNAAQQTYDNAVAAANAALQQALQDAQDALDDCLDGCPKVICGWIIICIWIF